MIINRFGSVVVFGLLLAPLIQVATAESRHALVIGNNAYAHATPLANGVRDADAVAASLQQSGFTVVLVKDGGVEAVLKGLEKFTQQGRDAEAALFYYSGHGVEVEGKNYLIPVDATLEDKVQLRTQAIALQTVLEEMAAAKMKMKAVVLDCCRDNPFATRSWRRSRSNSAGGLAPVGEDLLTEGTLLVYAASPGQVAADGESQHSPFTDAFLKHSVEPGVSLIECFARIAKTVGQITSGGQEPWVKFDGSGRGLSLFSGFNFLPGGAQPVSMARQESSPPATMPSPPSATSLESGEGTLRLETSPPGVSFSLRRSNPVLDFLQEELHQRQDRYAVRGLSKEENTSLKTRISELTGKISELQSQRDNLPRTGLTPADLSDLPTGLWKLVMSREGWPNYEKEVNIKRGTNPPITWEFGSGTVEVTADLPDVTIFEGEKFLGKAPFKSEMPTGTHKLIAKLEGFPDQLQTILVQRAATVKTAIQIPHGALTVESLPSGATVMMGDRKLGITPLTIAAPARSIEITLSLLGYAPKVLKGLLVDRGELRLTDKLEKSAFGGFVGAWDMLHSGRTNKMVTADDANIKDNTTITTSDELRIEFFIKQNGTLGYRQRISQSSETSFRLSFNGWKTQTTRSSTVMDIPGSQFVNGKLLCTNRVDSVHYDPNRGLVSITWSYDFADNNLNASVAADKRTAKMHFMLDATGSKLIAVEEEHLHDADEAYAKKRIQEHLVMKRSPILNTMTMSAQTYGVRVK